MPADIYQNKFAAVLVAAWHKLGHVFDRPVTAQEAWNQIGPYRVGLEQLFLANGIPTTSYAICRYDLQDKVDEIFGTVGADYNLLAPEQFIAAYDVAATGHPIETLGCLGKGETMFLTAPIRTVKVAGDEVDQYLALVNYMNGVNANVAMITSVRVVCQNTLSAALSQSTNQFRLVHTADIINETCGWISNVIGTMHAKADAVKEALDILAGHKINEDEIADTIKVTVPIPNRPRPSGIPHYDQARNLEWARMEAKAKQERQVIRNLYDGAGVGMDSRACAGTAFGLYNAVVEAYDHQIPGKNDYTVARSTLFGERQYAKQVAFNKLYEFSRN